MGLYSGSDRVKESDVIDREPLNHGWRFVTLQEALIKTIPQKRENQKGKMVV